MAGVNGNSNEASRFASEWRQHVMDAFDQQAQINRDVMERLSDLASTTGAVKMAVDDLKKSPGNVRSMLGTYGGCIGQAVYACITSLSLIVSVTAIVLTLIRR